MFSFEFGDDLNPELGFLPRSGTRQYEGGCSFGPRPARGSSLDWIRKYQLRNYYTRVDNLRGFNESWSFEFTPFSLDIDSGDSLKLEFKPQYEFLPAGFEISDGVFLPVGAYRFNRGEFEFDLHLTARGYSPLRRSLDLSTRARFCSRKPASPGPRRRAG